MITYRDKSVGDRKKVVVTGEWLVATAKREIPGNGWLYFGLTNGSGVSTDEFLCHFRDQEFIIAAEREPSDWLRTATPNQDCSFVKVWKS